MLHNAASSRRLSRTGAFLSVCAALLLVLPWRLTAQQATSQDKPAAAPTAAKAKAPKKAKKSKSKDAKPVQATPAALATSTDQPTSAISADNAPAIAAEPKSADNAAPQGLAAIPSADAAAEPAAQTVSPNPGTSVPARPADNAPAAAAQEAATPAVNATIGLPAQATTPARATSIPSVNARPAKAASVSGVRAQIAAPVSGVTRAAPISAPTSANIAASVQIATPAGLPSRATIAAPIAGVATVQAPQAAIAAPKDTKPGRNIGAARNSEKVITLELEQATCLSALKTLFKHFGVDYRIDEDASKIAGDTTVTLHLSKAPFGKALQMIIQSTRAKGEPLTYQIEGGVYIILPAASARIDDATEPGHRRVVTAVEYRPLGTPPTGKELVTVRVKDGDLRYVLKGLFSQVGANYTLDQRVQGKVTVHLTDVLFKTALESILRSTASNVPTGYRVEDGTYVIFPK